MKSYNFSDIDNLSSFNSFSSLKDFNLPEFCFAGRSNVGKSSMINSLLNRKKAATTSNKPGHTKKIFLYKAVPIYQPKQKIDSVTCKTC